MSFFAALKDYSKDISVTTISSVYVGKGSPFPSEHVLTCICSEIIFLVKINVYIKINYSAVPVKRTVYFFRNVKVAILKRSEDKILIVMEIYVQFIYCSQKRK